MINFFYLCKKDSEKENVNTFDLFFQNRPGYTRFIINMELRALIEIISDKISDISNYLKINSDALKKINSKGSCQKDILLITNYPHGRFAKIANSFKLQGYRTVLITRIMPHDEIKNYFDVIFQNKRTWDLLLFASLVRSPSVHYYCHWMYSDAVNFLKWSKKPVVIDTGDLLNGMLNEVSIKKFKILVKQERYCIEKAKGFCCRDMRTQFLKQQRENLPKRILYPEYAWGDIKLQDKVAGSTHVVYVGNMEIDPSNPSSFQYPLARSLAEAGIYFHMYPSAHFGERLLTTLQGYFDKLMAPELKKYIIVHSNFGPRSLIREISKYHIGIIISGVDVNYKNHDTYTYHLQDYFSASKVWDYAEAGLHTIAQKGKYLNNMLRRYNLGVQVERIEQIPDLCDKLVKLEPPVIPNSLLLNDNAERLIRFHEQISLGNS
jgi:hypothetical protein